MTFARKFRLLIHPLEGEVSNLVLQLGNFIEVCTKHLHPLDVVVPAKKTVSFSSVFTELCFQQMSYLQSPHISPMHMTN